MKSFRAFAAVTIGIMLAGGALAALPTPIPFFSESTVAHAQADVESGIVADTSAQNASQTSAQSGTPKPLATPESCSVLSFSKGVDLNCVWVSAMSWLGSWFLTIGGGMLRLAGILFDNLILMVIVHFKDTLTSMGVMDAVNLWWTTFRDFTNLLIIGLFVFIAICIILGVKEYGQKKLIANVLIIAVLINFSLLFCEIVIDGSNFFAFQIYQQMAGNQETQSFDIAAGFLKPMGITSVWDDTALVTAAVGQRTNSGLQAFLFGLIGGLLLLAVAAVLFYGCFLIIARAILFVFLMLTAALAFATYLIPSLARGEYGWNAWWKALFNNAVFAPLLMLFLGASLAIVNQAGKHGSVSGQTLGDIIANPTTNASAWSVILAYVLGIGLLFLSFKMASKFAGTISGFSFAAGALSTPFAATLRGLSPAFQRFPGGTRTAARQTLELEDKIKSQRLTAATSGNSRDYDRVLDLMKKKQEAEKKASASFNPMNSGLAQAIGKAAFVAKPVLAKTKGENYLEQSKKIAGDAAKLAAGAVPDKGELEAHAKDEIKREREAQHTDLKERHETNEQMLEAAKALEKSAHANANRDAQQQNTIIRDAAKEQIEITRKLQAGAISQAAHKQAIDEQDARIKAAKQSLMRIENDKKLINETQLKGINIKELDRSVRDSKDALKKFDQEITAEAKMRAQEWLQNSTEAGKRIARSEAKHHGDSFSAELAERRFTGRIRHMDAIKKHEVRKMLEKEDEKA